jgi:ABC-type Mn2+/Zn2+ transport system ATPase subunit
MNDPARNPATDRAWLEFQQVTAGYENQNILTDFSLQIPKGARVAIVGPNGAGKSTLFRMLVRLLPVRSGRIRIHGQPLGYHCDCVAYVPQREEVDWHFPVTVRDVVEMGRYGQRGWVRRMRNYDQEVVMRSLAQLGLSSVAGTSISDLSGGQQQRVFLARALAQEPHILLLDEPFNGVDLTTKETVLEILDQLRAQSVTTLLATHDLNLAAAHFDLVALINRELIAFGPPAHVLCRENIQRAFGSQALLLGEMVVVDHCCPE